MDTMFDMLGKAHAKVDPYVQKLGAELKKLDTMVKAAISVILLAGVIALGMSLSGGGDYEFTFGETENGDIFIGYVNTPDEEKDFWVTVTDYYDRALVVSDEPQVYEYMDDANTIVFWDGVKSIELDMTDSDRAACDANVYVYDESDDGYKEEYGVSYGETITVELTGSQHARIVIDDCDYGTVRTFG